jgi:hypothetical protein
VPLIAHLAKAGVPHYYCAPPDFFHHIFLVLSSQTGAPNRCDDASTVHDRELRLSPETNAFPVANFSRAL